MNQQVTAALRIAAIVFLAETAVMLLLSASPLASSLLPAALVDAAALTLIITPLVSYWVLRPFVEACGESAKALQLASRRNEMILNAVGEGLYGVDSEGRTTFINPAGARMLGGTCRDFLGRVHHDLVHHTRPEGSPYPREECPITLTLTEGRVHHKENELFWKLDGSCFPVEYVSTPILENGELRGAVVTFRDITERRRTEGVQKMMEVQLRQAQKLESIGQLAAGIAHEINTPTQFVNDNTRFLKDSFGDLHRVFAIHKRLAESPEKGPLPPGLLAEARALAEEVELDYLCEEVPRAIDQSLDGLQRISKIVQAMKEFSHPGQEEKTPIDINNAVLSTIEVSRNEWKYHAEMATELDPELPPIPCLPGEFNQVILNGVINGAHAISDLLQISPEAKGVITVRTRRNGNWVEIAISDTGTGIPEEIRPKIFDPFFTTKEVGKGTGQGLAIVYSVVVDKHQGSVEIESEVGKGTTLNIRLPIYPSSTGNE